MAAINFPSSPQVDDTFVAGEVTYIWDGVKWKANTYVPESVSEVLDTKQDTLVSGTNIKTINGTSLVGSGNATVSELSTQNTSGIVSATDDEAYFESTARTLPSAGSWRDLVYGNGMYVTIASSSTKVATSTDGITWSEHVLPLLGNWHRIAYGSGVFIAISSTSVSTALRSTDGITWTQFTLPTTTSLSYIIYANNTFVAVSSNSSGVAFTSPDGVTWTQRSIPAISYGTVVYGNGKFIATESVGRRIATSTNNGETWTLTTSFPNNSSTQSSVYANGLFVLATNGSYFITSPDGNTWTERPLPSATEIYTIAYGNGVFFAMGGPLSGSAIALFSLDGITWSTYTLAVTAQWSSVVRGVDKFVAVSGRTSGSATLAITIDDAAINSTSVAGNLTVTNKLRLSSVDNVSILGGVGGTFLSTNGAGNLSWNTPVPQLRTINNFSLLGTGNLDVTSPAASPTGRGLLFGASSEYSGQVTNSGNSGVGHSVTLGVSGNNSTYGNSFVGNNISFAQGAYHAVAIGRNATVGFNSNFSIAIGHETNTGQNNTAAIAIGYGVQLGSNSGRAIGIGSSVTGYDSIGIGQGTSGSYAVRIGKGSGSNTGTGNVILGYSISDGGNNNVIAINSDSNTSLSVPSAGFYVSAITSDTTSNVLYYDTTTKKITYGAAGGGGGTLDGLSDVTITSPTSGQVLKYNGTAWVNDTDETGGGEAPPTVTVTTGLLVPTFFTSYGSQDTGIGFNSTADRDYVLKVLEYLKQASFLYNNDGIFKVGISVSGSFYDIFITSNSSFYSYGANLDIYSSSRSFIGNSSTTYISYQARVGSAVLLDPKNAVIAIGQGSVGDAFNFTVDPAYLPYSLAAYPGDFAPNALLLPPPGTAFGPPRTGPSLGVSAIAEMSPGARAYQFSGTDNSFSSTNTSSGQYDNISIVIGKTTYVTSGGGGSAPAYTPSWFKLSADSPSNAVTPGPFTSPNLVPYEGNQVPVPTDFVPASVPPNYSLRGVQASLAPWGSNYSGWAPFNMDVATSSTGNFAIFRYSFNPYNVPSNIGFYSYDSNQGSFALTFFVKGSSIAFGIGAQDNSWASFNMSQSQSPYNLPSSNVSSPGGPFQAFKMVFVSDDVSPNTTVTNFMAAGQPFTPAHIDQVIAYDPNANAYYFVGLMTVTDPAVVSTINSSGFTMTPNNSMFVRAFGWFEV